MADQKMPVSIGDETEEKKFKLVTQQVPMPPGGRKGLISLIERIVSAGGVQKLTVQVGKPLSVTKAVQSDAVPDLPEATLDDDLASAARNAPMEEFLFEDGLNPFEYLFRVFHRLSAERAVGKALMVPQKKQLADWLGQKPNVVDEVFGIPVLEHKSIPDGAALLIGAFADDMESVKISLRLDITARRKKK